MASSPMNAKTHFHARSISLPSRPHPLVSQFDEHVSGLRNSKATSTSSLIGQKLSCLQDLHDCFDKLLLLPLIQKVLVQDSHRKLVDELLDGSLRMLDVCNTIKDALLHTKECVRELQSVIRRRPGDLDNEIKRYVTSRKVVKKSIQKALKNLKGGESKSTLSSIDDEPQVVSMIGTLREFEAITLGVFQSSLSFIAQQKTSNSRSSGWSLVSKVMLHKRIACGDEELDVNEFAMVDAALELLVRPKTGKSDNSQIENVQNQLKSLETCIQDLEEGIQFSFRRMIKTRVSLLNLFN